MNALKSLLFILMTIADFGNTIHLESLIQAMKKIAILLACTMMLAGCTELLGESNESTTYTNQDLDGMYYSLSENWRVEMNEDDTYELYYLELRECFDSNLEAEEFFTESGDETGVVLESCIYGEWAMDYNPAGIQVTSVLSSQSGVPYLDIKVISNNSVFICDDGDEIDGEWVTDGEEDCAGGEDENIESEANVTFSEADLFSVYLAADGNGAMVYSEDTDSAENEFRCVVLSKTPLYDVMTTAVEMLIEYEENGGEIDYEDVSTLPSNVADLFAPYDESFSNSIIQSLASECAGEIFLESSLMYWLWATSLAESNIDDTFSFYDFDVIDAGTSLSNASNESLVYVQMNTGDDLEWATVNLQLSVNDGAYMQCTNPTESIGNNCHLTDDGDNRWSFGEAITLNEGSEDLCDGSSVCEIQVKIIDSTSGNTMYESNYVSVGN